MKKKLPKNTEKKRVSIRLYPNQRAEIKRLGISLQRFVEDMLEEKFGIKKGWRKEDS